MTANEFQQDCLRTVPKYLYNNEVLMMGLMGLCGEAGECIDQHKKVVYHNHPYDRDALGSELSDVAWYLAVCAHAAGYTLEDIFKINVEKRLKRYPNGWEADRSLNRDPGDK